MIRNTKKILIVEDELPLLKVLSDEFSDKGCIIYTATKGTLGLKAALKHHPDIILLDIMMPKMDGLAMLEKLRSDAWGATANVVILTNVNDQDLVLDSIKNKVQGYFIKSDWNLKKLVDEVKRRM